jgi:hypothetical protein
MMAAIASGCGGTTGSGPTDSGPADVTLDDRGQAPSDAASDATPQDTACAVDADLTTFTAPDAATVDGGPSTEGCYLCIQAGCAAELAACNAECACKTDVLTFLACVGSGGSTSTCGLPLVTGSIAGFPLAQCVAGSALGGLGSGCLQACDLSGVTGGARPDGGSDAASGDATSGDAASGDATSGDAGEQ